MERTAITSNGTSALAAALTAALLAVGLAACGANDSTTQSSAAQSGAGATSKAQGQASQAAQQTGQKEEASSQGSKQAGESSKTDNATAAGSPQSAAERRSVSEFVPKQHSDSGGGAKQFQVKGGDNSVQEFGQDASSSEFEAAATALHNFLDARAAQNWAAACSFLASGVADSLEHLAERSKQGGEKSCAEILASLTPESEVTAPAGLLVKEAKVADVGALRVEGDRAFIIYTGLEGTVMALSMEKEGDAWKVGSLGAVPLS